MFIKILMNPNTRYRINSSQLNLQALITPRDVVEDARLLVKHNKNDELFGNKEYDESLQKWKREYIVPWGTLLDIFIVLLYMFFLLSYQTTKMAFVHNFNNIFDSYFKGDAETNDDDLTFIYFKDDFIQNVETVSQRFFEFDKNFPSQDPFERYSNLSVILQEKNAPDQHFLFDENNVTLVTEVAERAANSKTFKGLIMDVDYLITRGEEDSQILMIVKYSTTFLDKDDLGFIEWRSIFKKTETIRKGSHKLQDQLSTNVFPYGIIAIDSIAMLFTITRFFSFFKKSYAYAKKNYVSIGRAVMWKVDPWDLFNLFYRLLTFIAVLVYIDVVDDNFGQQYWLLVLLGCAAFVHTMGLFRALKMKRELWMVARLIIRSIGNAFAFFIGFTPLYVGYTFIGIATFGYFCNLFKGFLRSVKILFSIFHSDVVMDTEELIKSLAVVSEWVGNLYIWVWTNLTTGIIINVIISIVESTLGELIREQEATNQ